MACRAQEQLVDVVSDGHVAEPQSWCQADLERLQLEQPDLPVQQ